MIYDIGDKVTLSTVVRNDAGTPVNTPTLTIAVTRPDATLVSPAPVVANSGAGGVYTAQVTVDQAGLWTYVWSATGTVVAVEPGQFTVASARALVASMEELKVHLNRTDATDDAELRSYLVAATDVVEYFLGGPVSVQTFTEVHRTSGDLLAPRRQPLVAVISITPYLGSALSAGNYSVDVDTGVVRLRSFGWSEYTLVYTAGWARLRENAKLAGLMIAAHLWQVQNGGSGLPFPGDQDESPLPGFGFAIPNRAKDLLGTVAVPLGFA